ncbi:MAG: HAD family hydrolase [Lachnospiraceae bacterium]|nr:HAD family hydrolase [Acetatifactor muris]MCM1220689.1 HAD family hydrolase [Lachnospiraceae bacterium]MCM1560305.1 HAD family hydrolase [Butyrivibrio sp.]
MKTLYVSDLDGTLLGSNERTSEYTDYVINSLTEKGMIFSYATARSLITAKKVTGGICAHIPLIVYNGAFIMDNATEEVLAANYFDGTVLTVLDELLQNEIYPIVYAHIGGREKFSFIPEKCTEGMALFLDSRKGDVRTNAVSAPEALKEGNLFYITCIDEPEKLEPLYEKYRQGAYRDTLRCVYQKDIYTKTQWLEIMPAGASKANAVMQLKELLGCGRVIAFGDGKNDIDMFEIADECYAVGNAHEDLKKTATAVIGANDEDGVARWLMENYS